MLSFLTFQAFAEAYNNFNLLQVDNLGYANNITLSAWADTSCANIIQLLGISS